VTTPPVSSARRADRRRASSTSCSPFTRALAHPGHRFAGHMPQTIRESVGTPDHGTGVETVTGSPAVRYDRHLPRDTRWSDEVSAGSGRHPTLCRGRSPADRG
jgi:hypothetical protein